VKRLTYAVITPVRDEAEHVARLAAALEGQTLTPAAWVIVDTGSTDDTRPFPKVALPALNEPTTRRGA